MASAPQSIVTLLLALSVAYSGDVDAGKLLYRDGRLNSGRTLSAIVSDDVAIEGTQWSCERCHRRSGFGGPEGGTLVPPITAGALFQPSELNRVDRFPSLFEEQQSLLLRARVRSARVRPAYTEATLAAALLRGIDPTGHALDPAMPRYRLGPPDLKNLTSYLATLGRGPSPGVDETTIHFATVIAEGVDPADRAALLSVMHAWFQRKNLEADYHAKKQGRAAWHMEDAYAASRRWVLHVWELAGPTESWSRQLTECYRSQPVFAVVGGLAPGPWQPIADFCDRFEIPCLFPETALPAKDADSGYTVYFSRGLAGEAAALAGRLRAPGASAGPVVQLYRDSPSGSAAAAAFRGAFPPVVDQPLPPGVPSAGYWQTIVTRWHPRALVIWAGDADLQHFGCPPVKAFLSGALLAKPAMLQACDDAYFVSSYTAREGASKERARMRNWQLSRGIPIVNERIQLNAHFALALLDYSLAHMSGRFSREYLLETIEREAETAPSPGVFPRLSLGPGQRFASKSVCVVQSLGCPPGPERVANWIVP